MNMYLIKYLIHIMLVGPFQRIRFFVEDLSWTRIRWKISRILNLAFYFNENSKVQTEKYTTIDFLLTPLLSLSVLENKINS